MKSNYYIDERPIAFLFLLKYKGAFFLFFLGALFLKLMNLNPQVEGLSQPGYQAIVIFALAVILWITNIIPLAITSLLVMGLLSTFEVLDKSSIYGFFGDSAIFFILGAFIIAAAVSATGLSKRLAFAVLSRYGSTPLSIVFCIFILAALMSFLMPEHAVAALLFPILMEVARVLDLEKGSRLGKFMFLALCWGAVIGGVATFLGGARNPLAIGILKSNTGIDIGFVEWFIAVGPIVFIMMAITLVFIGYISRFEKNNLDLSLIRLKARQQGKVTFNEIKALVLLLITLYLWVFHGTTIGIANIALISAAMYFVLGVVTWEELSKEINWGTIFMYGGAITLGKSLSATGVLEWFVNNHVSGMNFTPLVLFMVISGVSILLTEGVSNAAVVGMLMPLSIQLCLNLGMDPKVAAYMVAVPAGLSFMLPMGTPPNAIAFSSGYYTIREAVLYGIFLNLMSWSVFVLMAMYYWPMIGLNI